MLSDLNVPSIWSAAIGVAMVFLSSRLSFICCFSFREQPVVTISTDSMSQSAHTLDVLLSITNYNTSEITETSDFGLRCCRHR